MSGALPTPRDRGLSVPADWEPHERTLIAWPTRADAWRGTGLDAAKACHTAVVDAVSQFEPVTVVANPEDVEEAQKLCPGNNVEVVGIPIDDSWLRDSGPIIVTGAGGERVGVDFDFNGWGDRFTPYENDRKVSTEILKLLGIERHASSLVLEGGSIVVDGSGLLATTEQCLLNENRNLDTPRGDLERALQELLGIDDVIWLDQGLAEDADTDGHVDNICAFLAPGRALLQTAPPGDPNHEPMLRNRARLEAAGVEVETLELLPRAARSGSEDVVIPYLNFYMVNGGAVVPTASVDPDMDDEALGFLRSLMPGREVIGVPALTLAFGGGGIHCITQQVPVA